MEENSVIDILDLCWNAVLKESMYNSNSFFTEKHCTEDETRDTDFDVVENRLAYMYKFGYYNAVFIQKCLESFLDKYSEGRDLFLRDLKVCSLSNGPGFDLIGFFCGIYRSFKSLKNLPVFKAVNLYRSWFCICHIIFSKVFQAVVESSNNIYSIPRERINFVQCDIYSTLSFDAQECIKDSDILLMVKVFASTKATPDVVIKSMEQIFSLLKTGSFVFFVGSKKNTKELTANDLLNKFVSCIFGPIKISIADLPINEAVVKSVSVKPKTSGNAYFIVWQKKNSIYNDSNVPVNSFNKKESVEDIHFNTIVQSNGSMPKSAKNIQVNKNKAHIVTETDICSASYIQKEKNMTTANQATCCLSLDKGVCDGSNSNSINNLQGTILRSDIQNLNDKISLPDASIKTIEIKNKSRILEKKSVKNSVDLNINESTARTPEINDNNKDLHLLLKRCDNLVTSLEKLTVNFKNSISLSNDQDTRCCLRKSCTKFKIHHAYMNPCCCNSVHSHCCRKVYNCHMFHHNTCTVCPRHTCERVEPS